MSDSTPFEVKMPVKIPVLDVADLLRRGLASGILDWCPMTRVQLDDPQEVANDIKHLPDYIVAMIAPLPSAKVVFKPERTDKRPYIRAWDINYGRVAHELHRLCTQYPSEFGKLLAGQATQRTADIFLQCCLWGDYKYDPVTGAPLSSD